MTNNLKEFSKELKSFAKKVKDFKYTDSALITFLLTGAIGRSASVNHFSEGNDIEIQPIARNTSIKTTWGGWQYGINGFYNNWQGHYKGHGDKVKDVKYIRSTDPLYKKIVTDHSNNDSNNNINNNDNSNAGAVHANNGEIITMNKTSLSSTPDISIIGGIDSQTNKSTKFGLLAENGGVINAQKTG